jgi:hypothetical protein
MFGLFRNKKKKMKTGSRIALTQYGAFTDLVKELSSAKKPVYIFYFFEESRNFLKDMLSKEYLSFNEVSTEAMNSGTDVYFIKAHTFNPSLFKFNNVKTVYCLDHYPLYSVFSKLVSSLEEMTSPPELITYGGLDEPLLLAFGGEKVQELMKGMGLGESEIVEHNMIISSIESAQKKIEEKVTLESKAHSPSEWFRLNYNH